MYTAPPLTPAFDLSTVQVTLRNVWAIRSFGGATGNCSLAIADGSTLTLTNAGSSIGLVSGSFTVSEDGATFGATRTFADPGLVTAEVGDVRFTADFTSATIAGAYAAGGTQYVLTATNI